MKDLFLAPPLKHYAKTPPSTETGGNMKFGCLLITLLLTLNAQAQNLCSTYEDNPEDVAIIQSLAKKLFYTPEELCNHERIMAIQKELRNFYYQDVDAIETHQVMTLHYSEYSCEYHFNLVRQSWISDRQYCYGTW